MTLHDAILAEAANVFLNPEEFAETMCINGIPGIPALWDDSLTPLGEASRTDPTGWGVISQTSVLCIPEADLACPLPDEEITVNKDRYTVLKATPQAGILRLELERRSA